MTDVPHSDPQTPIAMSLGGEGSLSVYLLRSVPEEDVWLAGQLSPHTRRAYKLDVAHFVRSLIVRSAEELRQVDRAAVVAWQSLMQREGIKPRTIRRRLSALSSLFVHLVEHRAADTNPVRDIRRPRVNVRQGTTRAFSAKEARLILDAPSRETLQGVLYKNSSRAFGREFMVESRHAASR